MADRVHWSVGTKTRCGIPVLRTQRVTKHMLMTAPRRVYAGQVIEIPRFLALRDRCLRCARKLRQDTGLLRDMWLESNKWRD